MGSSKRYDILRFIKEYTMRLEKQYHITAKPNTTLIKNGVLLGNFYIAKDPEELDIIENIADIEQKTVLYADDKKDVIHKTSGLRAKAIYLTDSTEEDWEEVDEYIEEEETEIEEETPEVVE